MEIPGAKTDTRSAFEDGTTNTIDQADCFFETLSNPRRREVLRYLQTSPTDGVTLIRDLSEYIAAWENDIEAVDVTYKQRKRVYTSLYQSHLPKLHRHGFIAHDADRGTVELRSQAKKFDMYSAKESEIPWERMYLGASAAAVAFVTMVWIGMIPFVTPWQALVACATVFTAMSIVYAVQVRWNVLRGLQRQDVELTTDRD